MPGVSHTGILENCKQIKLNLAVIVSLLLSVNCYWLSVSWITQSVILRIKNRYKEHLI